MRSRSTLRPARSARTPALRLAAAIAALPAGAFAADISTSNPNYTIAPGTYGTISVSSNGVIRQYSGDVVAGTATIAHGVGTEAVMQGTNYYLVAYPNGLYEIQGGSLTVNRLVVGTGNYYFPGSPHQGAFLTGASGRVHVTGGTLRAHEYISLGDSTAQGVLVQTGGLVSTPRLRFNLDANSLTSSAYYLEGGVLETGGIEKGSTNAGNSRPALLYLNGGVVRATAHNDNFLQSGITAMVGANHAVFDTNGFNIGYHGSLVADPDAPSVGGFTKTGAGTLSLYGANNHRGATRVEGGTLSIGWLPSLGHADSVLTLAGGALRITGTSVTDLGARQLNTANFNGGLDIADAANTFTLPHSLSGSGALTKSGAGTLVLSGASTRGGVTTLAAGTLRLGHSLALQNSAVNLAGGTLDFDAGVTTATIGGLRGTGSLALQNPTGDALALTLNDSSDATYSGSLSGSGSLRKTGAGALTLSGQNTHSGGTTVQNGTLRLAAAHSLPSAGSLAVASGATAIFQVGGANEFTASGVTAALSGFQNGSVLGIDTTNTSVGNVNFDAPLAGGFGLVKLGANTLTLVGDNTYTGGTIINGGVLQVGHGGSTGSLASPSIVNNNGTLIFYRATDSAYSGVISGTGTLGKYSAGTITLSGVNTFAGTIVVGGGLVEFNSVAALGNVANRITLGGGGLRWGSGVTTDLSARLEPLGANGGTFDTNGNHVSFATALSGSGSLTKSGAGSLTLNAVNTHAGGTVVNGGNLVLATGGQIGAIRGALTIGPGATVTTSANNALGWGAGTKINTLAITGGTLRHTAADSHGFGIAYTLDGATMISNGGVNSATAASHFAVDGASSFHVSGATPSTLSGRLSLRGDGGFSNVGFTVADGSRFEIAAGVSSNSGSTQPGPVGIVKSGAGVLALTGANTYTGNTTVNGGLVEFNSASALGASNRVILNGGGLRWASGTSTDVSARLNPLGANGGILDTNGNNVSFATALSGSGALTKTGAGTLTLSATNTHSGGTIVNGGVLELANSPAEGAGVVRGALTINSGATVLASATNALGYNNEVKIDTITINGGALVHTGALDQGWGIAYTLNGATLASNGGVSSSTSGSKFAFGGRAGANTSVHVTGSSVSTIAGRVDLRTDNGNSNVNFTVAPDATLAISAAITNAGGFTKLGAGLMVLSGANTYAGPTSVSAGTLRVDGSANNSAFTVRSGGTLGGSGSGGSVTVQSGGTLAPGNSPGLLTVNGDLTLDSGSFTVLEIAGLSRGVSGGYDAFNISGALQAGGALSVSFIDGFVPSGPATFDFFDFTSFGGSFAQVNLPTVAGHVWNTAQLSIDGTVSLVASAIPEPSSAAALAALAAAVSIFPRRARRRRLA